jgi:hypothetical protein
MGRIEARWSGLSWGARVVVLAALIPGACSGRPAAVSPTASPTATAAPAATSTPAVTSTAAPAGTTATADGAGIVWLCMPGKANNPCEGDLSTTVIDRSGSRTVSKPAPAADPPIDCFYVYPTASRQTTINADLTIDPEERAVAQAQAAPFSQVCKVYAPIYPQTTIAALTSGKITQAAINLAYNGVKAAWQDYLANYNRGRGIVFIGHSQGAMMLAPLLYLEIDSNPELRKLMVSALLMGGNVSMPAATDATGNFKNIGPCKSVTETGCVVGYSSFGETPPQDAAYGRVHGALFMLPLPQSGPQQILCVNPAAPGGKGTLSPIFATADLAKLADGPKPVPATPYVSYPDAFSAQCQTSGDATWLQITSTGPSGAAPTLAGSEGPSWGLHDFDVAAGLGNLIELVRAEAAAFGH